MRPFSYAFNLLYRRYEWPPRIPPRDHIHTTTVEHTRASFTPAPPCRKQLHTAVSFTSSLSKRSGDGLESLGLNYRFTEKGLIGSTWVGCPHLVQPIVAENGGREVRSFAIEAAETYFC